MKRIITLMSIFPLLVIAGAESHKVFKFGKNGDFLVTCKDRAKKETYVYNAIEVYYLNISSIAPEAPNELYVSFLSDDGSKVEHAVSHFETCATSVSK